MAMSKDKVRFKLGCRYYGAPMKHVLEKAFGISPPESDRLFIENSDGFYIVCRPSQFARFMIYRNKAGVANGFIDLEAKLIEDDGEDIYGRVSKVSGVGRCEVKRVLQALGYSPREVSTLLGEHPYEIDVHKRPNRAC